MPRAPFFPQSSNCRAVAACEAPAPEYSSGCAATSARTTSSGFTWWMSSPGAVTPLTVSVSASP
ncbi:hypothetical protein HEP85_44435 [Streptomyces sp. RPA4-2]|uniref:hypothetical protein n=1 Tax=Streptomyces sp. RPA4-2 TaxID=2721244 RepID=UPI0034E8BC8F